VAVFTPVGFSQLGWKSSSSHEDAGADWVVVVVVFTSPKSSSSQLADYDNAVELFKGLRKIFFD